MTKIGQATEAMKLLVVTAIYATAVEVAAASQMVEVPTRGRSGRQSQEDKPEGSGGKTERDRRRENA
jgi:hypothetical protein